MQPQQTRATTRVLRMQGVDLKASDTDSYMKVLCCNVIFSVKMISKYSFSNYLV